MNINVHRALLNALTVEQRDLAAEVGNELGAALRKQLRKRADQLRMVDLSKMTRAEIQLMLPDSPPADHLVERICQDRAYQGQIVYEQDPLHDLAVMQRNPLAPLMHPISSEETREFAKIFGGCSATRRHGVQERLSRVIAEGTEEFSEDFLWPEEALED